MSGVSQEFENKFLLYPKDGLVDIFIGVGIMVAGLFMWAEMPWIVGAFIPILLPPFKKSRAQFLYRRIGNLRDEYYGQTQQQKALGYITVLMGALVLVGIGIFFAFSKISGEVNEWLPSNFQLVLGGIFCNVWVVCGVILKRHRFHVYGLLTFTLLASNQLTLFPFWIALVALGGIIALAGLVILLKIHHNYPIVNQGR